ncbi:aminopeptidase N [Oricola cellulosilytica]|uniref:Aminopeptidase N n=1 Tax=Oricola cellulosilytica TaxID=1429082 RepID=A0A4R0PF83_9HYPH|nr:aminopeptidase N [Oricola cellulosilytica]TCD14144.1 aminopeptidase N [Oricola cellulosilytica]
MRTETGPVIRLEDYRPSDYLIDTTGLHFTLHPTASKVRAVLAVRRREGVASGAPLVLSGDDLALDALRVDGEAWPDEHHTATPDALTIRNLPDARTFVIEIETILDPSANKQLMGLYRSSDTYCTQCEAEGFRRITYYLDRPDILSVFTVRMEARVEDAPLLLSNGNRIESGLLDNGWHYAVWHDPFPKPSYLFALVAGNLGVVKDSFTTMSGRQVALEIYVEHGKEPRAGYAMDALKRSMRWDEEVFGREYDLDIFMIVAVSDFNMGAMENKGLNIFNDKYVLADARTATDADYANIEAIIAHEYFHNWTGNRITCRDWFQLCLKEGLTVFRDHEFSADQRSRTVKRISEVKLLKAHQFPEDAGPLAHPVRPRRYTEINNFYTATVYEKGSEVVRMIRTILGVEQFRKGLDLYFERHDGDAATIEDFLRAFEDASGMDLGQFSLWYEQPGTPNLIVASEYDAQAQRFTLRVDQKLKPPVEGAPHAPMHIPVKFGLVGEASVDLTWSAVSGADISEDVIHLREPRHEIVFYGIAERPVASLLRGFSAPVTVFPEPDDDALTFLARNDPDEYARWQALASLVTRQIKNAVAIGMPVSGPVLGRTACEVLMEIADADGYEPAYRALCLTLPGENDVAREIGDDIDPEVVHAIHRAASRQLGAHGETLFARLYHGLAPNSAYSPDAESAGRRSLRNIALSYLCHARAEIDLAAEAFAAADNMTDRAHALGLLAHLAPTNQATLDALDSFRTEFRDDPIVMDKWLMIQATAPGATTLETVRKLTAEPAFSWDNPNRIRSLIGAFATGNPTGFNRADGEGYRFLCEAIARIDANNPQVSARLLTAMRSWRNLESGRREQARAAMAALAERKNLSRDLKDILERTLA